MPLRINRVTLNTLSYTDLVAPFTCALVHIRNEDRTAVITIRSDPTDSNTAEELPPGETLELHAPRERQFEGNEIVAGAIVSAGTGPAVCRYS